MSDNGKYSEETQGGIQGTVGDGLYVGWSEKASKIKGKVNLEKEYSRQREQQLQSPEARDEFRGFKAQQGARPGGVERGGRKSY